MGRRILPAEARSGRRVGCVTNCDVVKSQPFTRGVPTGSLGETLTQRVVADTAVGPATRGRYANYASSAPAEGGADMPRITIVPLAFHTYARWGEEAVRPLRVVLLSKRLRADLVVPDEPKRTQLKYWMKASSSVYNASDDAAIKLSKSILYDVPPGTKDFMQAKLMGGQLGEARDAIIILKHLRFTRHLRSQGHAEQFLHDAIKAACATDDIAEEIMHQL